ncbi:MAG TPA: tryptophan synthase subunit alpha [Pyrinomonadaceae bacterium]|nr:tryptophan synthase subunit alpha [Pyrinomonadaceae bacterium]
MGRIDDAFNTLKQQGKKGIVPFVTAGDPDLATTERLLVELSQAGATLIELGVPFSDPMADGPVIQRASERALKNNFGLQDLLDSAARARKQIDTPIILFSYYNPLLQFGLKRIAQATRDAGLDGILVTDLTPEESGEFEAGLRANDLNMIFLIAPTSTDERLRLVAEHASGFIYAVSRAGVTGARSSVSAEAEKLVTRMRQFSTLPIAVGFGISNAEQVRDVRRYADAVVVGSAIVAEMERLIDAPDIAQRIGQFVTRLQDLQD